MANFKNSKKGISVVVQCSVLSIFTASSIPGWITKILQKKKKNSRKANLPETDGTKSNEYGIQKKRHSYKPDHGKSYRTWQIYSIHKFREIQKEHLKVLS